MAEVFDVVVVGGGPVGACAATLLARGARAGAGAAQGLKVALLEPQPASAPAPDAPSDARVVALSRASEHLLEHAGAWRAIAGARLSPYERMRVWHESVPASSRDVLVFDAADAGEPNLGYIAENRLLQAALLDAFTAAGGELHTAQFATLRIAEDQVEVGTASGALHARLVVGADGAQSALRAAAGLTAEVSDYRQSAIVAVVATARAHERTAWQRFMRRGTLAFLPLADGSSSIVWSADEELARRLMAASDAAFQQELDRASDLALGATHLRSARRCFPLRRVAAHHYVAQRVALIGDAAHVVHPLAGQGVNLGLMDAAALAQLVLAAQAHREDPGALGLLRGYERWRKSEVAVMDTAIAAFDRLLAHGSGPLSRLAQHGLSWVNRSQELRRLFIKRALGLTGELPEAARRAGTGKRAGVS